MSAGSHGNTGPATNAVDLKVFQHEKRYIEIRQDTFARVIQNNACCVLFVHKDRFLVPSSRDHLCKRKLSRTLSDQLMSQVIGQ